MQSIYFIEDEVNHFFTTGLVIYIYTHKSLYMYMYKHVLLSLDHLLSKECKYYPAQTDEQYCWITALICNYLV